MWILGLKELRNDNDDGNENVKKAIRIWFRLEKQQICTCLTLFLHFFAVVTRPRFAGYHQILTA